MPVFQCDECDGRICTLVITCNDDDAPIVNKDGTCDDIPCIQRTRTEESAVWRNLGGV